MLNVSWMWRYVWSYILYKYHPIRVVQRASFKRPAVHVPPPPPPSSQHPSTTVSCMDPTYIPSHRDTNRAPTTTSTATQYQPRRSCAALSGGAPTPASRGWVGGHRAYSARRGTRRRTLRSS
eukprot:scaffold3810_cov120-Isochrysis_galbana.AAC.7